MSDQDHQKTKGEEDGHGSIAGARRRSTSSGGGVQTKQQGESRSYSTTHRFYLGAGGGRTSTHLNSLEILSYHNIACVYQTVAVG